MTQAHHWIAVASAEHVALGRRHGFMQVCHGRAAPLRRVSPGDCVIYYSPTTSFKGSERLQAFTAIGTVREGNPYQPDPTAAFRPWRRDIDWRLSRVVLIRPLLSQLSFTQNECNWGYKFRFGLFMITATDAEKITRAMTSP